MKAIKFGCEPTRGRLNELHAVLELNKRCQGLSGMEDTMNGMGCCGVGMGQLGAAPWEVTGAAAVCANGEVIPSALMKPHYETHGYPLGRESWCGLNAAQRQALKDSLGGSKLDPKLIIGGVMIVAALALVLKK